MLAERGRVGRLPVSAAVKASDLLTASTVLQSQKLTTVVESPMIVQDEKFTTRHRFADVPSVAVL
jgi:hypothetical protein